MICSVVILGVDFVEWLVSNDGADCAADVICLFVHYLVENLQGFFLLDRILS